MAFLEWRKFNFFDLKKNVDDGKVSKILGDAHITAYTSGNGQIILCDSVGKIHLITKSWTAISFKGYETLISHALQLRNSSLLITIGEDEPNITPLVKIWDTSRIDRNGAALCVRILRSPITVTYNKIPKATAICAYTNLLAVGLSDGTIWLRRGDITRDKSPRQKIFRDVSVPITGLAFRITSKQTYLFVVTTESVFLYNITLKDKEHKVPLDTIGCGPRCSVLAESIQDSNFMVARDDAVYCYTSDGRGPCYAVDGEKVMLEWFRTYLVIISHAKQNQVMDGQNHLVTVLDIQNKFIVFSAPIQEVKAVLTEWGAFYLLGNNNEVYHLDEKDLQSKLSLLFKRNLYDVSIRIAKSQQYDSDSLIDIFRQYGDHLYAKGEHAGAIEQYIKTIGKLEASYVIRKFLDSQHIDKLTMYLQALHKQGHATEDHTTLLLNCYTKLNHTDKLKEFIMTKDKDLDFDIDIAIKVCRQASAEDALRLAKKYGKHDWYLRIQIEDNQKYSDALDYIANLEFSDAEYYMKQYGKVLIENVPSESTQFLKKLCSDYKPANKLLVSENMLDGSVSDVDKCNPDEFIHLFLNNSERLVEFLEYLIREPYKHKTIVYDTLIEHYLNLWSKDIDRSSIESKVIKLLQDPEAVYDKNNALIICQSHNFSPGVLYLYEEAKLYQQILRYQMRFGGEGDMQAALACCKRYGHQEPSLWLQALWHCARENVPISTIQTILPEVLSVIAKEQLLSPLLVLDALCDSPNITLGYIKNYLNGVLNVETELAEQELETIEKYHTDTQKLRERIASLRDGPTVFQGSRCAACHHQLELPAVHFMCQHSYHQHCFQSFSENDAECPACQPQNKQLLDLIKAQQTSRDIHETFHNQLERAEDAFSILAEYFGRGVFNKVTVVTDLPATTPQTNEPNLTDYDFQMVDKMKKQSSVDQKSNYGLGAEARLRLNEGNKSALIAEPQRPNQRTTKQSSNMIPTPEGRMRVEEQKRYNMQQYSSSLEANLTPVSSFGSLNTASLKRADISMKSPVEDEYDESKNPFAKDKEQKWYNAKQHGSSLEANLTPVSSFSNLSMGSTKKTNVNYDESKNPFAKDEAESVNEDDDYDKNLNPFL